MVEKNYEIEDMGKVSELFGSFDFNIKLVEHELNVQIINRGSTLKILGAEENDVQLWHGMITQCDVIQYGGASTVHATLPITAFSYASEPILALSGIEVGEQKQPDPQRPSVILKRAGEEDLWTLARQYGSTVDAICKANQISDEPHPGMMLLIPVC